MHLYITREDMNSFSLENCLIIDHLRVYDASGSVHLEEKSVNIFYKSAGRSGYCLESPGSLLPLDLPPLFAVIFIWKYFQ